MTGLCNADKEF